MTHEDAVALLKKHGIAPTHENVYSFLTRLTALDEGNRQGVPLSPTAKSQHAYAPRVARMIEEGLTHQQIANELGITRGRVSQIYNERER